MSAVCSNVQRFLRLCLPPFQGAGQNMGTYLDALLNTGRPFCCRDSSLTSSGFKCGVRNSLSGYTKTRRVNCLCSKPGRPNEQRGCEITRARVGCGKSSRRIVWLSVEQEIVHQRAKVKRSDNRAVTLSVEHGKPRGLLCLRSLSPPVRIH